MKMLPSFTLVHIYIKNSILISMEKTIEYEVKYKSYEERLWDEKVIPMPFGSIKMSHSKEQRLERIFREYELIKQCS